MFFRDNTTVPNGYYPLLDKTCTEQLKGIAIILVVLHHLSMLKFINLPFLSTSGGNWGVQIFLLLSGYGLAQSYIKSGIIRNYFYKRFKKIIPAYSTVTVLWIIIDLLFLNKAYSWQTILLALIGMDFSRSVDPTMWYITFIILWYIIFYFVFKIPINNIFKLGLLIVFSYLFIFHWKYNFTSKIYFQFQHHAIAFPIGICIGLYYSKLMFIVKEKAITLLTIAGLLLFFTFFLTFHYIGSNAYLTICSDTALSLAVIIFIMIIKFYNVSSRVLLFVGSISYELYLLEYVFIRKYSVLNILNYKPFSLFLYLALIILFSMLLRRFVKILTCFLDARMNNCPC